MKKIEKNEQEKKKKKKKKSHLIKCGTIVKY